MVILAREESTSLNHSYIGTEHLLLGLLREGGVAAKALEEMEVRLEEARRRVREIIGEGGAPEAGQVMFTPRGKKVLELSLREALQLGHGYIGAEHILLGLIREGHGVAAQVLHQLNVDLNELRQALVRLLAASVEVEEGPARGGEMAQLMSEVLPPGSSSPEDFPNCRSCFAPLAETTQVKTVDVTIDDQPSQVRIAYCGRCGAPLGTV